ncbi:P-loop NTPase fold protein [Enterococcus casseliflavus]|uniref:KAP family P-loop NTPase fold protein n=1 Tax=Enterococcus casseliflavus TaxID=37734 RepID=UPI0035DF0B3B
MDQKSNLTDEEKKRKKSEISKLTDVRNQKMKDLDKLYESIWGTEAEWEAIQEEQVKRASSERFQDEREEMLNNLNAEVKLLDNALGSLERELFLDANKKIINKNFSNKSEEDKLKRKLSVDDLASIINTQNNEASLNIGVIGEWGSGKTTFLRLLYGNLSKNVDNNVVWFNASQYEDQEKIWFSLLQRVSDKYLSSKICCKRIRFVWKTLKKNNDFHLLIIPLFFLVISTFALSYLFFSISNIIDHPALFGFLNSVLAALSASVGAFTGTKFFQITNNLIIYVLSIIDDDKELLKENFKYPNYKKLLGTREKVRSDLKIYRDLMKKNKDSKLIIMVDELDRCSETTILSFFSSIEAFLNIPGILFVFSINPDIVYPVVSKLVINSDKYGTETVDKRKSGADFIDKYIDLYFTLIPPTNYDDYVAELLENIDEIVAENIKSVKQVINLISLQKEVTPRQVKKILDTSLVFHKEFIDFTFEEITTIFFMQYYFSDFITFILSFNIKPDTKFANYYETTEFRDRLKKFKDVESTSSSLNTSVLKESMKFLKDSNKSSFERSENKILRILKYM